MIQGLILYRLWILLHFVFLGLGLVLVGVLFVAQGFEYIQGVVGFPTPSVFWSVVSGMLCVGLIFVLTGYAVWRARSWGRWMAIVLCFLYFFAMVLGGFFSIRPILGSVIVLSAIFFADLVWSFLPGVRAQFAKRDRIA